MNKFISIFRVVFFILMVIGFYYFGMETGTWFINKFEQNNNAVDIGVRIDRDKTDNLLVNKSVSSLWGVGESMYPYLRNCDQYLYTNNFTKQKVMQKGNIIIFEGVDNHSITHRIQKIHTDDKGEIYAEVKGTNNVFDDIKNVYYNDIDSLVIGYLRFNHDCG